MKDFRRSWTRFSLRNRDKGIPNLMLWLAGIKLVIFLFAQMDKSGALISSLLFMPGLILKGQIWRLFSYVLLPDDFNVLFFAISLFFYYIVGRNIEASIGRLRFNLFYFANVLILDVFGLILGTIAKQQYIPMTLFADFSLLFAYATVCPDNTVMLMFIIPIKMKYLAWLDTLYILYYLFAYPFPINLMAPLSLVSYFLFFGRNALYLLPDVLRIKIQRGSRRKNRYSAPKPDPNWANKYRSKEGKKPYHHKCTVCGRTDTEYPDLEFRYCSRCKGYYCYCSDHISDHVHITE